MKKKVLTTFLASSHGIDTRIVAEHAVVEYGSARTMCGIRLDYRFHPPTLRPIGNVDCQRCLDKIRKEEKE